MKMILLERCGTVLVCKNPANTQLWTLLLLCVPTAGNKIQKTLMAVCFQLNFIEGESFVGGERKVTKFWLSGENFTQRESIWKRWVWTDFVAKNSARKRSKRQSDIFECFLFSNFRSFQNIQMFFCKIKNCRDFICGYTTKTSRQWKFYNCIAAARKNSSV